MKYLPVLILLLYLQGCNQEQLVPGFPKNNYLLEVSQNWGVNSDFGSLPKKNIGENDLELRIWSGFGIRGDYGAIINRTNGNWKAYSIEVRTCEVLSHKKEVSDSLKRLVTVDKSLTEQINCNIESEEDLVNEIWQFTDSLFVAEIQTNANFKNLWKKIKDEGVLSLPSEVERTNFGIDGHSYVLELKIGETYHAYVVENAQPQYESDEQVRQIVKSIDKFLNTSIDGSKW